MKSAFLRFLLFIIITAFTADDIILCFNKSFGDIETIDVKAKSVEENSKAEKKEKLEEDSKEVLLANYTNTLYSSVSQNLFHYFFCSTTHFGKIDSPPPELNF